MDLKKNWSNVERSNEGVETRTISDTKAKRSDLRDIMVRGGGEEDTTEGGEKYRRGQHTDGRSQIERQNGESESSI